MLYTVWLFLNTVQFPLSKQQDWKSVLKGPLRVKWTVWQLFQEADIHFRLPALMAEPVLWPVHALLWVNGVYCLYCDHSSILLLTFVLLYLCVIAAVTLSFLPHQWRLPRERSRGRGCRGRWWLARVRLSEEGGQGNISTQLEECGSPGQL